MPNRAGLMLEATGIGLGARDVKKDLEVPIKVITIGSSFKDALDQSKESNIDKEHGIDLTSLNKDNVKFVKRITTRVRVMRQTLEDAHRDKKLKDKSWWKSSHKMLVWPMNLISKGHVPTGEWDDFASKHRKLNNTGVHQLLDTLKDWKPYRCIGEGCDHAVSSKAAFQKHIGVCNLIKH